jgi:hypothetical protein
MDVTIHLIVNFGAGSMKKNGKLTEIAERFNRRRRTAEVQDELELARRSEVSRASGREIERLRQQIQRTVDEFNNAIGTSEFKLTQSKVSRGATELPMIAIAGSRATRSTLDIEFDEQAGTVRCAYALNTGVLTTNDVRVAKLRIAPDGTAVYDIAAAGLINLAVDDAAEAILERLFASLDI